VGDGAVNAPPHHPLTQTGARETSHESALPSDQHVPVHETLRAVERRLDDLNLGRHYKELELSGYTVIPGVLDGSARAELRSTLLTLAGENETRDPDLEGGTSHFDRTQEVVLLLARGGVPYEQLVVTPRVLALVTALLGQSCTLSSVTGYVKGPGSGGLGLHADTAFVPDPLPPYAQLANVNYCLTDYTVDDGCLTVVPGSHRYCHRPRHADAAVETEPVEAPAGSAIVFHGNTWHAALPRRKAGLRLTLSVLYCRMYMRPQESYADVLPDAVLDRNPPAFRQLVGRELPLGWRTAQEAAEVFLWRRERAGEYYRTRSVHG
jgi:Phytanoyl-CoA dioxygenase (PhyH)